MKGNAWLTFAGYLLAIYLIVVPLTETALAVVPIGLGDPTWRFGAVGLFSRAMMTPLLGALIALGLALGLGHGRVVLGIAGLASLATVVLLVALPLFLLDGARMREALPAQDQGGAGIVVATTAFKLVLAMLVSALVGWGGWRAQRPAATPEGKERTRVATPRRSGGVLSAPSPSPPR